MRELIYLLLYSLCIGFPLQPLAAQGLKREGKDFALFFAVEDYNNWNPLRYPIDDAEALAQELKTHYGFDTTIIRNPSEAAIHSAIAQYHERHYAPDAQLFIFFSGHGYYHPNTQEGFFIPKEGLTDAPFQQSYLSYDRIKKAINALPCRHILLAIDACYSGTLDDQIAQKANPTFGLPLNEQAAYTAVKQQRFIKENLQYQSRLYLTSGGKERTPDKSQFVYYLLDALRSTESEDPILTYTEICAYLENAWPTPHSGLFGKNDPGKKNFLFIQQTSSIPYATLDAEAWQRANTHNTIAAYEAYIQEYSNGNFVAVAREQISRLKASYQPDSPLTFQEHATDLRPKPKMIFITGDSFQMGSHEGERDEQPVHRENVSDFYLAETEVTNEQFCVFLNENGNQEQGGATWYDPWGSYQNVRARIQEINDGQWMVESGYEKHPAIFVSWYGAKAYCEWLGGDYRLPTEAEWEYAAGGGRAMRNKWAGTDQVSQLRAYGNYRNKGGSDLFVGLAPVKSFRPNALLLYDLSGNVGEWCQDTYSSYSTAPRQVSAQAHSSPHRVYRGGSWLSYPQHLRIANREIWNPDHRYSYLGFRPARSP